MGKLGKLLSLVMVPVGWLCAKLRLSAAATLVIQHASIVFVTAFVGQVVGAGVGKFDWPTLSALAVSAAAAGGSAVWHYLVGLVPPSPSVQAKAQQR